MLHFGELKVPGDAEERALRAERRAARERAARLEAEGVAERGLRTLYEGQQRLVLLQRITDLANRARSVADALGAAVEIMMEQLDWTFGNVLLAAEDGGQVRAIDIWRANDAKALFDFVEASRLRTFTRGEGVPGRVLASGRPEWIADTSHRASFLRWEAAAKCEIGSGCAFPVMVGDEVVAVLEFFARVQMPRSDDLVAILDQAGVQLGRVFERERAQRNLLHDALHDPLTGLPNRTFFGQRLDQAFGMTPAERIASLAILVIDLNGFKKINDMLGHHVGDVTLTKVAKALHSIFCLASGETEGWTATVARMGGDEFTVLIENVSSAKHAYDLAQRAQSAIRAIAPGLGRDIPLGASIGIALGRADLPDVDQLLRDADLAMYEAKSNSECGGIRQFDEQLGAKVRAEQQVENELREGLARDEFELFFQPIVDMGPDHRIRGYEALVRWHHPARGTLGPGEFIEIAERSNLILFLGDWILRSALAAAVCWPNDEFVSINIAAPQFAQPSFANQVKAAIIAVGLDPRRVHLELTETVAILDIDHTRAVLEDLNAWGVHTSLDDFGTGFSSLSSLRALPFSTLKIDRSFVEGLGDEKVDGIITAILALAKIVKMSVVAEGIEDDLQAKALSALGCEMGQGYLFGRPLSIADRASHKAEKDNGGT